MFSNRLIRFNSENINFIRSRRAFSFSPGYSFPRRPRTALIIKKRGDAGATAWALKMAVYLKDCHQIEAFVEPKAQLDLPMLRSVADLARVPGVLY